MAAFDLQQHFPDQAEKKPQPAEQKAEGVTGPGEDGVDAVTVPALGKVVVGRSSGDRSVALLRRRSRRMASVGALLPERQSLKRFRPWPRDPLSTSMRLTVTPVQASTAAAFSVWPS